MNRQVSCLSTLPKMPRKQENKESEQEFQFKSGENRAASTRRRLLGREGTLGPHLGDHGQSRKLLRNHGNLCVAIAPNVSLVEGKEYIALGHYWPSSSCPANS